MNQMKRSVLVTSITIFITACASIPHGTETSSQLAMQLRQIVDETQVMNGELSQLIDVKESNVRSIQTLAQHPQFKDLYKKSQDFNARILVDPSRKDELAKQILATLSEEEINIMNKGAELNTQAKQLAARWERYEQQALQVNATWKQVTARVLMVFPDLTSSEQTQLSMIMQERVNGIEKNKRLMARLENL